MIGVDLGHTLSFIIANNVAYTLILHVTCTSEAITELLTDTVQTHPKLPATFAVQISHFPSSTRNRPVTQNAIIHLHSTLVWQLQIYKKDSDIHVLL